MNLKLSYFHFLCNIVFFLLGCTVSSLLYILELTGRNSEIIPYNIHRPKVDLIIIIISSPSNRIQRETIRESWLKLIPNGDSVVHFFAVGEDNLKYDMKLNLDYEHSNYGDILLLPVNDSYRNLTLKLSMCLEAITNLYNFNYVLKLDDDSFLHYQRFQEELKRIGEKSLYWGYFSPSAHVFTTGRWKENQWFLCDRYLPYALGGGYLLAYSLSSFIAENYRKFKIYSSEDVSVGVWLSAVNTRRIHDIRFDTQAKSRGCRNDQLLKHKVSIDEMKSMTLRLKNGFELCQEEFSTNLKPYSYDWQKKPSMCCHHIDPANNSVQKIYSSQ